MLTIVPLYEGMKNYIDNARQQPEPDLRLLWQQWVIDPYWHLWAAGQHNEARTRDEISDPPGFLDDLEISVSELISSNVVDLVRSSYEEICRYLPYHEGNTVICIMAGGPECTEVVGTCIGGSTLLTIPAARPGWEIWVKYVLAHERHHSAWGYHYYYVQGLSRRNLLFSLISEGAADTFAHYLCPGLTPAWVNALTCEEEARQWQIMQPLLFEPDENGSLHRRFFFGDSQTQTPSCTGYTIGFHILQEYWKLHPYESVTDWTLKEPEKVLAECGYPARQA
jgi:hypothetical protein